MSIKHAHKKVFNSAFCFTFELLKTSHCFVIKCFLSTSERVNEGEFFTLIRSCVISTCSADRKTLSFAPGIKRGNSHHSSVCYCAIDYFRRHVTAERAAIGCSDDLIACGIRRVYRPQTGDHKHPSESYVTDGTRATAITLNEHEGLH